MKKLEDRWWFSSLVTALTVASTTWLLLSIELGIFYPYVSKVVIIGLCVFGLKQFYTGTVRALVNWYAARKRANNPG